jgi:kynurenine formamidase
MRNTLILLLLLNAVQLTAQTRQKGPWWPHPLWGAADQAGASNWITNTKVLQAISKVKQGKVIELGHLYEASMPLSGERTFALHIPSFPTHGPIGPDKVVFNDEFLSTEIGQVGTQFDGLGHPGRRLKMADGTETEVFYNGFNNAEMNNAYGLKKLGIEHVKPILTTATFIDIAALKGLPVVANNYQLTLPDLLEALKKQQISESDITPGDALLFHFGYWRHWPQKFVMDGAQRPSISMEVIQWIKARQPSMVGSDCILDGSVFNVHTELTMKEGIFNLEWMNFEKLLPENPKQFMFIFTPVKFKGATGSPGNPIAVL